MAEPSRIRRISTDASGSQRRSISRRAICERLCRGRIDGELTGMLEEDMEEQ